MNKNTIRIGFILSGLANILGVSILSRLLTNEAIPQTDPVIMSEFGLLMIMVWGLVFISVSNSFEKVRWLIGVFVIEKLVYVIAWFRWILSNDLSAVFEKDAMAGIFYAIYGPNDLIFLIFFAYVFFRFRKKDPAEK